MSTENTQQKALELKNAGNAEFSANRFQQAIHFYTQALVLLAQQVEVGSQLLEWSDVHAE